jgi:hypothetical protein
MDWQFCQFSVWHGAYRVGRPQIIVYSLESADLRLCLSNNSSRVPEKMNSRAEHMKNRLWRYRMYARDELNSNRHVLTEIPGG